MLGSAPPPFSRRSVLLGRPIPNAPRSPLCPSPTRAFLCSPHSSQLLFPLSRPDMSLPLLARLKCQSSPTLRRAPAGRCRTSLPSPSSSLRFPSPTDKPPHLPPLPTSAASPLRLCPRPPPLPPASAHIRHRSPPPLPTSTPISPDPRLRLAPLVQSNSPPSGRPTPSVRPSPSLRPPSLRSPSLRPPPTPPPRPTRPAGASAADHRASVGHALPLAPLPPPL